jgi:pimeloyl-ACP methyl ester carboxylesterase
MKSIRKTLDDSLTLGYRQAKIQNQLTRATQQQNSASRMALPLRNSRIKLPLGQIFWREVGQGPILVFLHGSWNDGSQWLPLIEHLSQDYHCFAPDLLGFGESEHPKLHYSIELQVECLLAYLEALHIPQVFLVAHSLGGWIAASYALKYVEQVSGLILIAPEGVPADGYRRSWRKTRWLIGRPPIASSFLRSLLPLARLFGRHKGIEQALQLRQQLKNSPTACQLLFRRRWPEIQSELLQEQLEWMKVPTLILQGANDTLGAIARSQTYANKIPNAHLQIIEQGGNDLPEALPGLVASQIHNFVQQVESWQVGRLEG